MKNLFYRGLAIMLGGFTVSSTSQSMQIWSNQYRDQTVDEINTSKIDCINSYAFENAVIKVLSTSWIENICSHAAPGSQTNLFTADTINNIGEYTFDKARIGHFSARLVNNIANKAFFNSFINVCEFGKIQKIGEGIFEKATINSLKIGDTYYVADNMFNQTELKRFDIMNTSHLGNVFQNTAQLVHIGLPDNLVKIEPNCFRTCDTSKLNNMTVYGQDSVENRITSLFDKIGSGSTSRFMDTMKTLNITPGENILCGYSIDLTDYMSETLNALQKDSRFDRLSQVNLFMGDLPNAQTPQLSGVATSFALGNSARSSTKSTIEIPSGKQWGVAIFDGNPENHSQNPIAIYDHN